MESKSLRELSALYLDSVYDEGYKPYPKEKVDKQKDKAYKKEMIARGGKKTDEKDKEADKQYERRIAMDFKTKMRKEEVQDEEFKALTPDKKDQIRNQAERRKKSADRAQNASDYETSTKQDRQVRKMKSVLNNEVEIEFVNSLIESGLFSEEEIKIILWNEGHQRDPEKGEEEEKKRSENVPGERTPMPPRGDKRREDFEKWYAANVR